MRSGCSQGAVVDRAHRRRVFPAERDAISDRVYKRPSARAIGGKRRLTGEDWMIEVLVIA